MKNSKKRKAPQTKFFPDFTEWVRILDSSPEEVETAWNDLQRRKLIEVTEGTISVAAEAMTQAYSDVQRRLASYLSGYELTENSYIVRIAGSPPGSPMILNTRISVEYIANYFRQGWGVADIRRDLPNLKPEQIEAAIQYYLNHRDEIERDIQRSIDVFERNLQQQESSGRWEKLISH